MKLYALVTAATILGLFLALLCPRCGEAWFGRWWRRKKAQPELVDAWYGGNWFGGDTADQWSWTADGEPLGV